MITELSIQHFKSIENLELELGPVTVFVGQNGVGKSNIIDAIKFVRDAISDGLDHALTSRHGIANVRQWSPTRPYNLSIRLGARVHQDLVAGFGGFGFTLSSTKESYAVIREELNLFGRMFMHRRVRKDEDGRKSIPIEVVIRREKDGSVGLNDGGEVYEMSTDASEELFSSSERFSYAPFLLNTLSDFESYTIFPNTLREPQKQSNEPRLMAHGENLASVIKRMRARKRSEAINEIIAGMRKVVPDLENISAQSLGGFVVPRFLVRPPEQKAHTFDVDQVSDGTLRILGILVALYQEPGPSIIALEEPELTVHPGVLQLLADAIKEVSRTRQILVTTHSPDLIEHFEPDQIVAVEMEDGVTKARPLASHQTEAVREQLFSLGELMRMEGLHG